MITKKLQCSVFIVSILIHLFFYISANYTHTLDIFFEHVTAGQDFFQIPNAAYSFLHGGSLSGNLPQGIGTYTTCCGVNSNVYHPLFTLLVGIPLQFFQPWTAFAIWEVIHLIASIILVVFLWRKFFDHKYIYLALSIYLLNSYHYYEIQHAQYHFLFNLFTVFFVYESIKNGDSEKAGFWLFLSLLVKPIGLLWIIPLIIYKRFKTLAVGLTLFVLVTIPFIVSNIGNYYINNLLLLSTTQISTYNLFAITNFIPLDIEFFRDLTIIVGFLLVVFQLSKRLDLFKTIFLWISFQLIFYSLVFHYHYSILAGLIAMGVLLDVFVIKRKLTFIPIVMLTLPTPIIFFHILGNPAILPKQHLSLIALWSIFWLLMLCFSTIFYSFRKTIFKV